MINQNQATQVTKTVLISGSQKPAFSVVACFLEAGYAVTFLTENAVNAQKDISGHLAFSNRSGTQAPPNDDQLTIVEQLSDVKIYPRTIVISPETLTEKKERISLLEDRVSPDGLLAITTESIPLAALQAAASQPEKIIGANWAEPAHNTRFLEIIANTTSNKEAVGLFFNDAKAHLGKDPYLITGEQGIRTKLFSAMVREAFFLVENGYASIPDIDRACRNDAGYYLPFAGNCRYMDLMGTNSYGMVMKELNKELSKARHTPPFFNTIIENKGRGMKNNQGFYEYKDGEADQWQDLMNTFSRQISKLIDTYPFHDQKTVEP